MAIRKGGNHEWFRGMQGCVNFFLRCSFLDRTPRPLPGKGVRRTTVCHGLVVPRGAVRQARSLMDAAAAAGHRMTGEIPQDMKNIRNSLFKAITIGALGFGSLAAAQDPVV